MPWFRVDDSFHNHPKVLGLSLYAVGVWLHCGAWSAHYLTEGRVPVDVVRKYAGRNWRRYADELVKAGLWDMIQRDIRNKSETTSRRDIEGFQFHDWHAYQPSKDQVLAEREANAARQRRARERAKAKRNGVTPSTNNTSTGNSVTLPPSLPPSGGDGRARTDRPSPSDEPQRTSISDDPKTNAGTWRSADAEAAIAAVRKQLPTGYRRKPNPPMDDQPPGGVQ